MLSMVRYPPKLLYTPTDFPLGAATTAVRDQIMRHNPQSGIFCGSYINEKVRFIVQDAVLDQPTDAGFLRAFTHMSLTCDPRAPANVPRDVIDALPPDLEIQELEKKRQDIRKMYKTFSQAPPELHQESKHLKQQMDSLKKQRDRAIKVAYRRDYFYRIHNEELERQLSKTITAKYVEPVINHQLPERSQLQRIVCDLSKDLQPKAIIRRRICAIDLMVALSARKEAQCRKRYNTHTKDCRDLSPSKQQPPLEEPFPIICKKTQCIICIGDNRFPYEHRTRTYATTHKMMNHVNSHLKGKFELEEISCTHPVCKSEGLILQHLDHFKSHVKLVHGITLRS